MRILLVTDAWEPQVNGVVRTLKTTARELTSMGHEVRFLTPLEFRTLPCPTYPEIRLSLFPQGQVNRAIREFDPDVLHIATEGPLGMAARRFALRHDFPFTTAYHTRFPEYVHARFRLPLGWSYAWLRNFHRASKAVMAPTQVVVDDLRANGFQNVRLWSRDAYCTRSSFSLLMPNVDATCTAVEFMACVAITLLAPYSVSRSIVSENDTKTRGYYRRKVH